MKSIVAALFVCAFLLPAALMAQKKTAFVLYDQNGKKISYKKILKKASSADFVFFGELHDNPIAHWLQLELLADLIEKRGKGNLVVGMEMLESHQQVLINKYLSEEIDAKTLGKETKLWGNHDTDYQPVIDLAKSNGIPVIATNIPRKYAKIVAFKGGVDSLMRLSETEKAEMVPLPFPIDFEIPSYKEMRKMMEGHGTEESMNNFVSAQAIKDATMAHFAMSNWSKGKLFYHLNGSYHSDDKEGIIWYILQQNPTLNIFTLTLKEQENMEGMDPEYKGKADVIITVPSTMTKTYHSTF